MSREWFVKLLFMAAVMGWIAIGAFFPSYSHAVVGANEVYRCGWGTIIAVGGFVLTLVVFAWYLWRRKRNDNGLVFLIAIPIFGYIFVPELVTTRVELTPTRLIHYRKLMTGSVDVNLAFRDVVAAYEIRRVNGNDGSVLTGYVLGVKDGPPVDIPTNEVLTGARERINASLAAAGTAVRAVEVHTDGDQKVVVAQLLERLTVPRPVAVPAPSGE
jgi:uncharacterized membrane protein (DUF485 family)